MNRMINQEKDKKFIIVFGIVFVISLVIFISLLTVINHKFRVTSDMGLLTINTTESIVPNDNYNTTAVSFSQDKTVSQVVNKTEITSGTSANLTAAIVSDNKKQTVETQNTIQKERSLSNETEKKPELSFMAPVVGEIITDYADESLVYSKTLDEWTTHLGIDIKANKTSSVVAAEEGIVKSVKNDPRYGLTVIISHDDGYETLYANLLSADFVKVGDQVNKNQTIGTVGESASFEISDPPHLHFEILKNGENINPTTLIK